MDEDEHICSNKSQLNKSLEAPKLNLTVKFDGNKSDGEIVPEKIKSALQRSISLQNTTAEVNKQHIFNSTHDKSLFERQSLQNQLPLRDQKQVQFASDKW